MGRSRRPVEQVLGAGTSMVHLEPPCGEEPPGKCALEWRVTRGTAAGSACDGPAPALEPSPPPPPTLLICLVDTILPSSLFNNTLKTSNFHLYIHSQNPAKFTKFLHYIYYDSITSIKRRRLTAKTQYRKCNRRIFKLE